MINSSEGLGENGQKKKLNLLSKRMASCAENRNLRFQLGYCLEYKGKNKDTALEHDNKNLISLSNVHYFIIV